MSILGIDYGIRKAGLAIFDEKVGIAQPIEVIHPHQIIDWLNRNKGKYLIDKVVIGLPGNAMDKSVYELGEKITTQHSLPVSYFDETLTTQEAQSTLRSMQANRSKVKKMEDAVASALMLQSYYTIAKTTVL